MKITKLERQALRLTICLARGGSQMTLPALSKAEHLSEASAAQVMGRLRRGGVVTAARGRHGGYELAVAPEDLTVRTVLRSLGPDLLQGCFNNRQECTSPSCPHVCDCGLRPVWELLEGHITEIFDQISIADLLQREQTVRGFLVAQAL